MSTLPSDLRFAARLLRRTPGFTIVAILTLGTAIGACTAIYSIVYALVLRPLPYPRAAQLVQLAQVDASGRRNRNFSDPNFEDVRARIERRNLVAGGLHRGGRVKRGGIG